MHGTEEQIEEVPPAKQYAQEADHFAQSVRAGCLLPPAENGLAQARDRAGHFTQVDFPCAASTDANGVNAEGIIVGDFFDNAGVEHGYIAVH